MVFVFTIILESKETFQFEVAFSQFSLKENVDLGWNSAGRSYVCFRNFRRSGVRWKTGILQ